MKTAYYNNICEYFRCSPAEIQHFRPLPGGLVNESYIFELHGNEFVYRHPGKGSEQLIVRENEKQSLLAAREYGFDPTFLYMDENEGWKISRYVRDFREPDYKSEEDSAKAAKVLRRLHKVPYRPAYGIRPWEDALELEKMLKQERMLKHEESSDQITLSEKEKHHEQRARYETLKANVQKLCQSVSGDGIEKCFCHGDSYKPNWMILPDGEVILIDWEYAGFADPGIDVGYYIADAGYDLEEAKKFIREYLGDDYSERKEYHFLAYTAIIAWYWYVWALYREASGTISSAVIREPLTKWRDAAERFTGYLL